MAGQADYIPLFKATDSFRTANARHCVLMIENPNFSGGQVKALCGDGHIETIPGYFRDAASVIEFLGRGRLPHQQK
jgi:hypothetical protein